MREVRRPAELDSVVKRLVESRHSLTGDTIFRTIREVLCFAAILGFQIGRRIPVGHSAIGLDSRVFVDHPETMDTVYLIALAAERRMDVLLEDREDLVLTVFEEYAAGGLAEIEQWLRETPGDMDGDRAILAALRKYGYLSDHVVAQPDLAAVDF